MVWMLLDYSKKDGYAQEYTDQEKLASAALHGNKLVKYWSSFKYLQRAMDPKTNLQPQC